MGSPTTLTSFHLAPLPHPAQLAHLISARNPSSSRDQLSLLRPPIRHFPRSTGPNHREPAPVPNAIPDELSAHFHPPSCRLGLPTDSCAKSGAAEAVGF
jgi:hypothetical protein